MDLFHNLSKFIQRFFNFYNYTRLHWLILFIGFFVLHIPIILAGHGKTNMYILLGEAFLSGKLNLQSFYWDASVYQDKFFCPFPPFPALLTMPFIALFGSSQVNSVLLATIISLFAIYFLIQIIIKLEVAKEYHFWILIAFFFGTGYWYTLITSHHVNGFAHVTCTALLLATLHETLTKQRTWLLGILIGCAFLTRQFTIFYSLFIVLTLFFNNTDEKRYNTIISFACWVMPFIVAYLTYNYFRFANPLDTGYGYLQNMPMLKARIEEHGLFSIHYFFYNAYHMFIKGPNILFKDTSLQSISGMDTFGCSLLMASPFVIAALKTDYTTKFKITIWVPLIIILIGGLLFHNNGFEQINTQRFTIDFLPLLFILICSGCKSLPIWLFRGLVTFSLILNIVSFTIHQITTN